ncbi:MAG: hypothetical protein ABSE49_29100, partial [Polyangiaceae bacterium]
MYVTAPSGSDYGDTWYCTATDINYDQLADLTVTTPTNTLFNKADVAVLEVQGLAACDGLPDMHGYDFVFELNALTQFGTGSGGWDSYNSVLDDVSWYSETFQIITTQTVATRRA